MIKYSKGLTPSAIQHKYKLTYEQGFELATIINNQQAEINRLREALKSQIEALGALKGFYPETYLFADDNIRRIRQALNGESEGK